MLAVGAGRDRDDTPFDVPCQHDRRRRDPFHIGDLEELRFAEQAGCGQRRVGHHPDTALVTGPDEGGSWLVGMGFDLDDRRQNAGHVDNRRQLVERDVTEAERSRAAAVYERLQSLPRFGQAAVRRRSGAVVIGRERQCLLFGRRFRGEVPERS